MSSTADVVAHFGLFTTQSYPSPQASTGLFCQLPSIVNTPQSTLVPVQEQAGPAHSSGDRRFVLAWAGWCGGGEGGGRAEQMHGSAG